LRQKFDSTFENKLACSTIGMNQLPPAFWSVSANETLQHLGTAKEGLSSEEARQRLARYSSNLLKPQKRSDVFALFLAQFKSPLILILLFATGLSFFLHDPVNALIILTIILVSGLLGFWQEHSATNAVEKLLAVVQIKAAVLRDGSLTEIPIEEVVPGDIVILDAGDIVPGDCLVLESKDLFVDEATLTGETYPVEKSVGVLAAATALAHRTNALWMGTHVTSGSAKALVISSGKQTEFGKVSERLKLRPPETEFEHGIGRFGYFLMEVTLVLVLAIFAINVYLAHQPRPRRQTDGSSKGDRQTPRID
jgi:P-type Mg2+ transporter